MLPHQEPYGVRIGLRRVMIHIKRVVDIECDGGRVLLPELKHRHLAVLTPKLTNREKDAASRDEVSIFKFSIDCDRCLVGLRWDDRSEQTHQEQLLVINGAITI